MFQSKVTVSPSIFQKLETKMPTIHLSGNMLPEQQSYEVKKRVRTGIALTPITTKRLRLSDTTHQVLNVAIFHNIDNLISEKSFSEKMVSLRYK